MSSPQTESPAQSSTPAQQTYTLPADMDGSTSTTPTTSATRESQDLKNVSEQRVEQTTADLISKAIENLKTIIEATIREKLAAVNPEQAKIIVEQAQVISLQEKVIAEQKKFNAEQEKLNERQSKINAKLSRDIEQQHRYNKGFQADIGKLYDQCSDMRLEVDRQTWMTENLFGAVASARMRELQTLLNHQEDGEVETSNSYDDQAEGNDQAEGDDPADGQDQGEVNGQVKDDRAAS